MSTVSRQGTTAGTACIGNVSVSDANCPSNAGKMRPQMRIARYASAFRESALCCGGLSCSIYSPTCVSGLLLLLAD